MAAILGLEDADVVAGCEAAAQGEVVQAANFNSPGQVVIAGKKTAVERAIAVLNAKGAKRALILPVSAPSHTPLMKSAADNLAAKLAGITIQPPTLPVYTVTMKPHGDVASIRDALYQQLVGPVRWTQTIRTFLDAGFKTFIECGPGKVLTGLNKRIDRNKELVMLAIEDSASLEAALNATNTMKG